MGVIVFDLDMSIIKLKMKKINKNTIPNKNRFTRKDILADNGRLILHFAKVYFYSLQSKRLTRNAYIQFGNHDNIFNRFI